MTRRVGILGGTFDPIHVGHLDAAGAAARALALDRILLVPSLHPPHRAEPPRASAFHRFAMTAFAAATQPEYEASDLELHPEGLPGPSYTIDTLRRLHGAGFAPLELFFVTGADAFSEIAAWKGYPELFEHAHFVVVSRPHHPASRVREQLPELASSIRGATPLFAAASLPSIVLVDGATRDVSSTDIRRACREGRSIDGFVPLMVEGHIRRHGLYGAGARRP